MRLLIISNADSELARLLKDSFAACDRVPLAALETVTLDDYDAFALLGGVEKEGAMLLPPDREALYQQVQRGKRVFAEYCYGIGQVSFLKSEGTRFDRPVLLSAQEDIAENLAAGTIFDEQTNDRMVVWKTLNRSTPILQYVHTPEGFYAVQNAADIAPDFRRFALWVDEPGLLVCCFRMANFASAKFAPRRAWEALLASITAWLGGHCPDGIIASAFEDAYSMGDGRPLRQTAEHSAHWFTAADQLVFRGGKPYAVREGMKAEVTAEGAHAMAPNVRLDCTGEASLMYYLEYMLTGNAASLDAANGLRRFPLDMQITQECPHRGMVRGSLMNWWNTSYQDDAARGFLLPIFWRALLSGETDCLPRAKLALDYLLQSTGTDGLRVAVIDFDDMNAPEVFPYTMHCQEANGTQKWIWDGKSEAITMPEIHEKPANTPSAHYNAFYMAALLLGHRLLGDERYLETAVRGLTALMGAYPNTAREHSETQEMCRLIMPLALLYWRTGEEKHREWLYRVTNDLQRMRHPSGGYMEWDSGYTSICHNSKASESSAFAANGDPVCDMLYSINWLPFAFMVAHCVTKDAYFYSLWEEIAGFFASVQIHSQNPAIDGAWPRAVDMDTREVYGVPNDIGWSPWTIESGWTVAEITSGMLLGLLKDQAMSCFDRG